jgi:hypothetical protein
MKRFLASAAIVAIAAIAVPVAGASLASAASNAGNVKLCQKSGWQNVVRQDGSTFQNQSDCIKYAARRGTLATSPIQTACESIGGTFSSTGINHWTCTGWPVTSVGDGQAKGESLAAFCGGISSYGPGPDSQFWNAACAPFPN